MIERAKKKNHLHLIVDLCNEVQWVHATYTSLESWTDFSTRTLDHISAREKFKGFAVSPFRMEENNPKPVRSRLPRKSSIFLTVGFLIT